MPKHPTPAQREASRRNGQKSQGPHNTSTTRFNATKHGLLSRKIHFETPEEREAYEELHAALVEDIQPQGALQQVIVERLASAHVRQIRAVELRAWWERPRAQREAAYASGELVAGPWVFTSGTDAYWRGGELILRYERELQRQFDQALRQLSATAKQSVVGSRQSAATTRRERREARRDGRRPHPQPPLLKERGTETAWPVEVGPGGKVRPMRDPRCPGQGGKRRFVVHHEPSGPVVIEEPNTPGESWEEVEKFFEGLDDRLKHLSEIDRKAKEARAAPGS